MLQRENFINFANQAANKYPVYKDLMMSLYDNRYKQLLEMYDEGVLLLAGTDAGKGIDHGMLPEELALWQKVELRLKI